MTSNEKRVGLVTSTTWQAPFGMMSMAANVPDDDRLLEAELVRRGAAVSRVAWDDASVDWSSFGICVLRSAWNYNQKAEAFSAWLDSTAQRTLLCNAPAAVRWNLNKQYLRQLAAAGVPIVPTVWAGGATGEHDVGRVMDTQGWSTIIFKPDVGNTGAGVVKLARSEIAKAEAMIRESPGDTFAIQPYFSSVETAGELSLAFFGGEHAYAVNKYPAPGEYSIHTWGIENRRLTHRVDSALAQAAPAEIATAEHALRTVGLDLLYARVDFLRDPSGVYRLSEIEAVSPQFYFKQVEAGAGLLTEAILARLG